MPKIWKQQPWEVLEQWINDILTEASDDLNDWETKFIDDMMVKVANRWSLTQAQEEKLESIYVKRTS